MVKATMGGPWSSMGLGVETGRMKMDFMDVLTLPWGCSMCSSLAQGCLVKEIDLGEASMIDGEDGLG